MKDNRTKSRFIVYGILSLMAIFFFTPFSTIAQAYDMDGEIARKSTASRLTLGVTPFENRTNQSNVPIDAITHMLRTELISTDLFEVVEDKPTNNFDALQATMSSAKPEMTMTGVIYHYDTGDDPQMGICVCGGSMHAGMASIKLDIRVRDNKTGFVIWGALGDAGTAHPRDDLEHYAAFYDVANPKIVAATYKAIQKIITRLQDEGHETILAVHEKQQNTAQLIDIDWQSWSAAINTGRNDNVRKGDLFAIYAIRKATKDRNGNVLKEGEQLYVAIIQAIDVQAASSTCKLLKGKWPRLGLWVEKIKNVNDVELVK